jgi:hypothetical protein
MNPDEQLYVFVVPLHRHHGRLPCRVAIPEHRDLLLAMIQIPWQLPKNQQNLSALAA